MSEIRGNKADLIITDGLDLMTPEEIYKEVLNPNQTIDVAKVYETYGTSKKAITNSNVGAIHTADDIIFPDMLGGMTNEQMDAYINEALITGMAGVLLPLPFHRMPDFMVGDQMYDLKAVPTPNMIHAMDARNRWPDPMYAKPRPRPPTKRQKTLKARALNKANRKRARK